VVTAVMLMGVVTDDIDVMTDAAVRDIRTQFMRHYRVIKHWEPAPVPPLPIPGDAVYGDQLRRTPHRRWFRT
jgi:hypothetical protein